MNVHLRPDGAYDELLAMRYVIEDFILTHPQYFDYSGNSLNEALEQNVLNATLENKPSLKTNHPILIVGDFNADCSYISPRRQELLRSVEIRTLRLAIDRSFSLSSIVARSTTLTFIGWSPTQWKPIHDKPAPTIASLSMGIVSPTPLFRIATPRWTIKNNCRWHWIRHWRSVIISQWNSISTGKRASGYYSSSVKFNKIRITCRTCMMNSAELHCLWSRRTWELWRESSRCSQVMIAFCSCRDHLNMHTCQFQWR